VTAGAGKRVRLRIVNSGSDATFAFFVEGQKVTVTHADSVPVRPVRTEALILGPGERYDAIVKVPDGVTRLIAAPMGKKGVAMAVLRATGARARRGFEREPFHVPTRVLPYHDLRSLEGPRLSGTPRRIQLDLGKVDGEYKWLIGGQAYPDADRVSVGAGEYVRFVIKNATGMIHPMHLHGHFFRVGGPHGPVKDTFLPPPTRVSTIDWVGDNPGHWAYHCHNEYHLDTGMLRVVDVA
jgi:FtsP/CotA-like multicopper oxidase with cupredoxin domain